MPKHTIEEDFHTDHFEKIDNKFRLKTGVGNSALSQIASLQDLTDLTYLVGDVRTIDSDTILNLKSNIAPDYDLDLNGVTTIYGNDHSITLNQSESKLWYKIIAKDLTIDIGTGASLKSGDKCTFDNCKLVSDDNAFFEFSGAVVDTHIYNNCVFTNNSTDYASLTKNSCFYDDNSNADLVLINCKFNSRQVISGDWYKTQKFKIIDCEWDYDIANSPMFINIPSDYVHTIYIKDLIVPTDAYISNLFTILAGSTSITGTVIAKDTGNKYVITDENNIDLVEDIKSIDKTNYDAAYTHSQETHAPDDAEKNVQSDWNAVSGDAFILNKPTITASRTDEEIMDVVGGMLSGNTETGITVTYDDSNNEIDFAVSAEYIEDTVNTMIVAGDGITKNYNDSSDSLTITNDMPAHYLEHIGTVDYSTSGTTDFQLPGTESYDGKFRVVVDGSGNTQFYYKHESSSSKNIVASCKVYTGVAASKVSLPETVSFSWANDNTDTVELTDNLSGNYRYFECVLHMVSRSNKNVAPLSFRILAVSVDYGNVANADMIVCAQRLSK